MSKNRRFQYALEPILLTRKWGLDDLLLSLSELNGKLEDEKKNLENLNKKHALAIEDWQNGSTTGSLLAVDKFMIISRYLADLDQQLKKEREVIAGLEQERDSLIEKVVAARKALEAVEEHKGQMEAKFMKFRLSGDFKIADDQWNMMHGSGEKNEH